MSALSVFQEAGHRGGTRTAQVYGGRHEHRVSLTANDWLIMAKNNNPKARIKEVGRENKSNSESVAGAKC